MNDALRISRRRFIFATAAAGGGLLVGLSWTERLLGETGSAPRPPALDPSAFIRIGTDDMVTIIVNKSEMGQGVYTSLPMLIAEELECDWSKVRVESAPVGAVFNHTQWGIQGTGGSSSVSSSWEQHSRLGAAARLMLIQAAALEWQTDPGQCRAEGGVVVHEASGRRLSYGQLAARAAALPVPQDPPLKDARDYKLIGKPVKRLDTPDKLNGKAVFGLDVRIPDLRTALVARAPVFGGKVRSVNAEQAKAIPGVEKVVEIETGVAVIARSFWPAKLGRDKLEITWDDGANAALSTDSLRAQYQALSQQPGAVARRDGDAAQALASAARQLSAEYEVPYLAHAPMEPLNCVVKLDAGRCELWTGTQFQTIDAQAAAAIAGLTPEQVQIHTTLLGGGFGRRANPQSDFVKEAVRVAKAAGVPVQVIWTREDDIKGGYYRPFWYDRIAAGLDQDGKLVAWKHTIVGQSIVAGTAFEAVMVKDGVDATSVEGAANLPYGIPNVGVELHSPAVGVPVQWWRSVGHSHTAFVVETFLDEVAHAAGQDPVAFRRALLANAPRHRGVLDLAAEKAGWTTPPAAGRARGVAVHASFGSWVAQIAEVSIEDEELRVHRVVCAIDCGRIVNPDTIAAQMESGIVYGLSAALHGAITLKDGRVEQSNFHDYPVLRMREMPVVEVYIVPSTEPPGGVGEPGTPPIAPAVCNALFGLTGKRIRRLPIASDDLRSA